MAVNSLKPPRLLKTILDFLFVMLIISVAIWTAVGIIYYFLPKDLVPIRFNDEKLGGIHGIILSILGLLGQLLFIYIILKFKSLVRLFFKGEIYTYSQVKNLRKMGSAILIYALIDPIPFFIYKHFLESNPRTVDYGFGFDSFLFIIALGLFFIFLSRTFENAGKLKAENDLTI